MKGRIKSEKAIASTDAIMAVILIALFGGLIATITSSLYTANTSLKRMAQATNYMTDVFEYVDQLYYDDVTLENLEQYCSEKDTNYTINSDNTNNKGYKVTINVRNYNENDNTKLDLVKKITMSVEYKVGKKPQIIEMNRIKKRENLVTPNSPDLSLLKTAEEQDVTVYPIKYLNDNYYITEQNDTNWYNYFNGYWAIALKTTETFDTGDIINLEDNIDNMYMWIPRYGHKEDEILFLYGTTNYYLEKSGENDEFNVLSSDEIQNEYVETAGNQTGSWVSLDEANASSLTALYPIENINNIII